jgi:hypothetical protein
LARPLTNDAPLADDLVQDVLGRANPRGNKIARADQPDRAVTVRTHSMRAQMNGPEQIVAVVREHAEAHVNVVALMEGARGRGRSRARLVQ